MTAELIHLVCGSTGAGKTTYSHRLASELSGVVFSIDEWMVSLFADDAPKDMMPKWFVPRVTRCEHQIRKTGSQLVVLKVPIILDLGFQRKEHRQKYTEFSKSLGLSAKFHFLDIDAKIRWERVDARNKEESENYHLTITRDMFDYIETIWEPPTLSELSATQNKRTII